MVPTLSLTMGGLSFSLTDRLLSPSSILSSLPITLFSKNEFGEYYTTPIDPIIGVPVKITASGLVLNSDSSLTITDPVDTLIMIPICGGG